MERRNRHREAAKTSYANRWETPPLPRRERPLRRNAR